MELSAAEREQLESLVSSGSKLVRNVKRAQILLAAGSGLPDVQIAGSVKGSRPMSRSLKIRGTDMGVDELSKVFQTQGTRLSLSGTRLLMKRVSYAIDFGQ